jgi:TetR/AcrR family transcriptional regulator, lmrAB and yxaGH operons repressor
MTSKRDEVLFTAWRLFESQGYHATGINQIISESGVPKGSFYHYFPDGKEGLACEALSMIGDAMREKVEALSSPGTWEKTCQRPDQEAGEREVTDFAAALSGLLRHIARRLAASEYREGGPLTTVALETATTNERLNLACRAAYRTLIDAMVEQVRRCGFDDEEAREIGTMIIASIEGGIILCRTFHSTEPLEQVAAHIEALLRSRTAGSRADNGDRP